MQFPLDNNGKGIQTAEGGWTKLAGFSPFTSILSYLPNVSLELSNTPRLWNITSSLNSSCNTLLLDTSTKKPVMHWVELDHSSDDANGQQSERALLLWPGQGALKPGNRYIVAMRNMVDGNGQAIPASAGFAAIRDKTPTSNPALEANRARFADIFNYIENSGLGWSVQDLTIAWDFTVNTADNLRGTYQAMRDDAFARTGNGSQLQYAIDVITDNYSPSIARMIQGHFYTPLYLNSVQPGNTVRLVLDPVTGKPQYQGMAAWNFTVMIPAGMAAAGRTGKVLQYGHVSSGSWEGVGRDSEDW